MSFAPNLSQQDIERFDGYAARAPRNDRGCWLWPIVRAGKKGYGSFWFKTKALPAHRVAYFLKNGPIPDQMSVCHSCDVRNCVNPDHLWLGTNADNVRDRNEKGRDGDRRGTKNGRAKLTEASVSEIRELLAAGEQKRVIAVRYGVSDVAISMIGLGKTWRHVGVAG